MQKNFVTRNNCPVCNCSQLKKIYSLSLTDNKIWSFFNEYYKGRVTKEKLDFDFCVVKCSKCTLLFQKHILNDDNMFLLYEKWISAKESLNKKLTADISFFSKQAHELKLVSKMLNKKPHEINILEFGMGWGFWLNQAKSFNYKVTGVELSEKRIAHAKNNGINIINNISSEKNETYDYIYSNQVFEHVDSPKKILKNLSKILKKDGIIHIQVPNGHGIEKGLKKSNWKPQKNAIQPLEHINCFNRKALKQLAKQNNLKLIPPKFYLEKMTITTIIKTTLKHCYNYFYSTQVFLQKK